MKKPNFAKIGVILILGALAFVVDHHNQNTPTNQDRIVAQLRVLHEEYRNSFSKTERDVIARRAIDLIEGNPDAHLPSDLNGFFVTSLTMPME